MIPARPIHRSPLLRASPSPASPVSHGTQHVNGLNLFCVLALCGVGCVFVYSAQLHTGQTQWKAHLGWVGIGLGLYGLASALDYRKLLHHAHWIYALSVLLLALTLTPLGKEINHVRRWVNLSFYYFQPVEFAKLGTLVLVASLLTRSEVGSLRQSLGAVVKVGLAGLLPFTVVFLQPDLGSALVFPAFIFALLYVSKLSSRFFLATFGICVLMACVVGVDVYRYHQNLQAANSTTAIRGVLPLKDYQRKRILAFFAPESVDPKGIGSSWNLKQSLISVGSGGLVGKGWQKGTQAKLGYLPQSVAHNDFVFSVLAEETGFIGGLSVVGLYALLILNGLFVAQRAGDRFGMFLGVGISTLFMVHVFVNVGMTLGLVPITGIPLPFISYGGSFLISCCLMQGLMQSLSLQRKPRKGP